MVPSPKAIHNLKKKKKLARKNRNNPATKEKEVRSKS
jgi:hypothetical protein